MIIKAVIHVFITALTAAYSTMSLFPVKLGKLITDLPGMLIRFIEGEDQ
jgi:hypothetical protein